MTVTLPSKSLALTSLCALFLAACSSTPIPAPAPPVAAPKPVAAVAAPAPAPATPASTAPTTRSAPVTTVNLPPYLDPKSEIATARSVYFDFDNFAVKPEFSGLIERQGQFLGANPQVKVKIEGHADERGGSEYNLALGQKRAEAVLKALKVYGVKDTQVEAVSWGNQRPKAQGHDEAAWAQNRRADLQYPKQ